MGTPQEITDSEGTLAWAVDYHAYGNVARERVKVVNSPLRFQGQYYDEETGLHYNRHRYYSPETGRFITVDPIGLAGGLNNYQYVKNPTGWVDPLGLEQGESNCPVWVSLSDIKYTQRTVYIKSGDGTPVLDIAKQMKENGWDLSKGVPDLIKLDDGYMTLDHRRIVAADWAGLDKIPSNVRGFDDLLPDAFKQSGRYQSFQSPVAFSDIGTRTTFDIGDLPDTWGQAAMIRSLQQQQKFADFPITGSNELPSFTFKDENEWAKYINQLIRLKSRE